MLGFNWIRYIGASVRPSGFREYRDDQERIHDIATNLLMGKLFTGFDERSSGTMDRRFKASVGNAIRNMAELERNRRRLLPTVPIDQECEPGRITGDDDGGEKVIQDFRRLVKRRLGDIGIAVLNVRLAGGETKSLVGGSVLGSPGKWGIKRAVQQIKQLHGSMLSVLGIPGSVAPS